MRSTGLRAMSGAPSKARHEHDFYPTPPEATRALLEAEALFAGRIWEPACGQGHISKVLEGAGHKVLSSDLNDYGFGSTGVDFLLPGVPPGPINHIITNPPFSLAQEFIEQALRVATGRVCMLLRLAFLEGQKRKPFFESTPLARVHVFSNRVPMWRGGDVGKGTSPIAYAWFVWDHSRPAGVKPELSWITWRAEVK